jgi:5-formyltetrahydrofolate cyclo-ligase
LSIKIYCGGALLEQNSEKKRRLRDQLRRDRELSFMPESWLHIVQSHELKSATTIASYINYDFEPQTTDINAALIASGKSLLLPRTLKDRDIEWVLWDGSQSSLRRKGKIFEPVGEKFSNEGLIDAVIVPALHIDREGNRLGQGGGSYDRALSRVSAWKVAIVGALEIGGNLLPVETHDQKVNAAATPTLLLRFTGNDVDHH